MQIYLQDPVRNLTALRLEDPSTYSLYTTIVFLKRYYTPGLIFTGLLGNIVSCLTLRTEKFHQISAVPYITALAAFDSVFLGSLLAVWLSHFGVDLYNSESWCELLTYTTYICGFLSVWLMVCLAVDRAATVYSEPGRVQKVCTPLKAKMTVIAFVVVAITVFLNVSLLYGLIHTQVGAFCITLPQFATALGILSKMDMAVNFLLPYVAIITLIVATAFRMRKIYIWRKTIIQTRNGRASLYGCIRLSKRQKEMCLPSCLLCMTLVALNSPSHLLRLYATLSNSVTEKTFLLQQFCMFLMFTRSGLNLPILALTSPSFRSALYKPFAVLCRHRPSHIAVGSVHRTLVEFSLTALGQQNAADKV